MYCSVYDWYEMSHGELMVDRTRMIEAIVAEAPGIYGAEVCQVCGQIGTFSGWASAVGSHFGKDHQFIASGHRHPKHTRRQLDDRSRRHCEVCCTPVTRELAQAVSYHWLCDACSRTLTPSPERGLAGAVTGLVMRRYIDMQSDEHLARWVKGRGLVT